MTAVFVDLRRLFVTLCVGVLRSHAADCSPAAGSLSVVVNPVTPVLAVTTYSQFVGL